MKQADKEIIGVLNQIKAGGGGGGAGTWGSITGTLASQGDLNTALNGKQPADADLTSWAALTRASGFDTFATTPSGANLSSLLTSPLPLTNGGTGQTTALAALQALTPKGADIASASTTDLSTATGSFINVTGTATINAFGTVAAGSKFLIKFTGAGVLTYNATSLILPGAASITRASGDVGGFESLGSGNWQCLFYYKADGTAIAGGSGSVSDTAFANTWDGVTTVAPSKNALWDAVGVGWNYPLSVYAAGTAYSLTGTAAAMTFGTTNPVLVLDKAGTYKIEGRAYAQYNGATYASNQTATVKLRRTNNTAADIANATTTAKLRVITTITDTVGVMPLPPVTYTTTNTNDSITLFGSVSSTPAAGSVDISEASIFATLLYGPPFVGVTYLVNQNFETPTTGYDNGETWASGGGTVDPAYTGTVILGTQSLRLSGTPSSETHTTFTAQTSLSCFGRLRILSMPVTNGIIGLYLQGSSHNTYTKVDNTGAVTFVSGGVTSSASATTLTTGVNYYWWMDDVASGTGKIDISATSTRPTTDGSGNVHLTGTCDAGSVDTIYCYKGTSIPADILFDHVLVSTTSIGNNP